MALNSDAHRIISHCFCLFVLTPKGTPCVPEPAVCSGWVEGGDSRKGQQGAIGNRSVCCVLQKRAGRKCRSFWRETGRGRAAMRWMSGWLREWRYRTQGAIAATTLQRKSDLAGSCGISRDLAGSRGIYGTSSAVLGWETLGCWRPPVQKASGSRHLSHKSQASCNPGRGTGKHLPRFLYPFTLKGHLGCFHISVIMNNAAPKDMGVQIFLWDPDFS